MSVELHNPNQTAAQSATAVPDMVSLPEETNVASGMWYVAIDLASVLSSFFIKKENWCTYMAHLVKCPALGFGLSHDLKVREFKPCIGLCTDRIEPAWDSLSLPLPSSHACTLSLKISK